MTPFGALAALTKWLIFMNKQKETWTTYWKNMDYKYISRTCLRCKIEYKTSSSDLGPQLCQDCRDYINNKAEKAKKNGKQ